MRNLFALTTALERFGLTVLNAESGEEAIYNLEKHHDIDIVLMDIMMPEMDGYELCQKIRQEDHETPIMMLTNLELKGSGRVAVNCGADDYLLKPNEPDQLIYSIDELIQHAHAE